MPGFSNNLTGLVSGIITGVISIIALVAVVMIIIGGVRYTTSSGNADAVKAAKNQIMYAIIGLVICALSLAIVTFVTSALTNVSTANP